MAAKTKLELTWIGKVNRPRLEPRILIENSELGRPSNTAGSDENLIIQGDNLLALRALESSLMGRVGCIYIDPPYNTGSAFPSYDDNLEHSLWLSHMRDRLIVLWGLLRQGGTILISINDDEGQYLKVLCDELFGRSSFKSCLVWNTEGNTDNQSKIIRYHEYVLVYTKGELGDLNVIDPNISSESKLNRDEIRNTIVKNGPKNPISTIVLPAGFPASVDSFKINPRSDKWPHILDKVKVSGGKLERQVRVSSGWSSKNICESFIRANFEPVQDSKGQSTRFEITQNGAVEAVKVREAKKGHFISVLRGFGTTNQMRLMLERIGVKFSFPKPVGLIKYLLEAFSEPDDIILDSYAGSGTTGHAVLQLNAETGSARRFVLIEQFASTTTDVLKPRIDAVIDGHTKAEIEPTGGGYAFFNLAPSLLSEDNFGRWTISQSYDARMLSEAISKHLGFTYSPSPVHYWMHGHSTENDFIYVTPNSLAYEQLQAISLEVGSSRSLVICCKAFMGNVDDFPNLTLRKIPRVIVDRCDWGRDDYSLKSNEIFGATEPMESLALYPLVDEE